MHRDAWFPIGFELPGGCRARSPLYAGDEWQILEPQDGWRLLIAREALADRWISISLLDSEKLSRFSFGNDRFACLDGGLLPLAPLSSAHAPDSFDDAIRGARAFRATRAIAPDVSLQDAIYAGAALRFLPVYGPAGLGDGETTFTTWLTGGVPVPLSATARLRALCPWAAEDLLDQVVQTAGLKVEGTNKDAGGSVSQTPFRLVGRPELEQFFSEHVIDIARHEARYKALGVSFPGAIALHGPPGCGKTFAVDKLVAYLGWPSFAIDASTIGSPYIHETSRKVAQTFEEAARNAPAIVVIDEMDAFLAERQHEASGQHRVEEVAEFLRRLAEAPQHKVLVIGMTNRIEAIDQAVLRRGRFDHVIKVDMASEAEVAALLMDLITALPHAADIDFAPIAAKLAGRPLSDVSYLIREAARRSARDGSSILMARSLNDVLAGMDARSGGSSPTKKVGFLSRQP
jgi:hypothetical protein